MIAKILKFLGAFFIAVILCAPAVGKTHDDIELKPGTSHQDGYIYIHVYENGKHLIYVYQSDGINLVTVIEEEW